MKIMVEKQHFEKCANDVDFLMNVEISTSIRCGAKLFAANNKNDGKNEAKKNTAEFAQGPPSFYGNEIKLPNANNWKRRREKRRKTQMILIIKI